MLQSQRSMLRLFSGFVPNFGIVYRFRPRRSIFDQTAYIDDYIPKPTKYHETRKPRLTQWDDPNVQWPRLLPRSTNLYGKRLLHILEKEELIKNQVQRDFFIPSFNVGDVLQFHYVHSVSEKTGNTYTGICVQKKKENSLLGSFRVIAGVAGGMVNFLIKLNSPLLTDFKVLKKGDGKARSHLIKYWKSEFSAQQLKQPRIKQTRKKSFIQTRVPKNIKGIVFDPLELPKTPEPGQE